MGNCLVTRFNGVVDNDNLPIYDELIFNVVSGMNNEIGVSNGVSMKVTLIPDEGSDIHFTDSTFTANLGLEVTTTNVIYINTGSGKMKASKYDFYDLAFKEYNGQNKMTCNIEDFKYSYKLYRLMTNVGTYGNMFSIANF